MENKVDIDVLNHIKEHCFDTGEIQKFPPVVFVKFTSKKQPEGYLAMKKVVSYLNESILNLEISIIDNDSFPKLPTISIDMKRDIKIQTNRLIMAEKNKIESDDNYLAVGDLKLFYKNDSLFHEHFCEEFILNSLSGILGLAKYGEGITQIDLQNNVVLKPQYLAVLNLLYHPGFPSGLKIEELQAVINTLEKTQTKNSLNALAICCLIKSHIVQHWIK